MTTLDSAKRAYEAAKVIQHCVSICDQERIKATYEAALLADAQARFPIGSIVDGGCGTGRKLVRIDVHVDTPIYAVLEGDYPGGWVHVPIDAIRPYVDPVVKEFVLGGWMSAAFYPNTPEGPFQITLSNVTPADLDAMKPGDVIESSYKIERMK